VTPDFNPWGHSKKNPSFYPSHSLSSIISPAFTLPNRGAPPLFLLSFTSLNSNGGLKIQPKKRLKFGSKRISQGPSSLSPSSSLDSTQDFLSKGIQIFFLPDLFTWCKDLNLLW
jgi:hypothetical protein